jgi:hypothetical protein
MEIENKNRESKREKAASHVPSCDFIKSVEVVNLESTRSDLFNFTNFCRNRNQSPHPRPIY